MLSGLLKKMTKKSETTAKPKVATKKTIAKPKVATKKTIAKPKVATKKTIATSKQKQEIERLKRERAAHLIAKKEYESKTSQLTSEDMKRGIKKGSKGRSARALRLDARKLAMPKGKRISSSGTVYYEYRTNRTDGKKGV